MEIGNRVEKLYRFALGLELVDDALELFGNEALRVHRNVHDVRLIGPKSSKGPDIRGGFREDDVARVDKNLRDEVESLLRAGGDDDVVRMAANAVGAHDLDDHLAQFIGSLA